MEILELFITMGKNVKMHTLTWTEASSQLISVCLYTAQ